MGFIKPVMNFMPLNDSDISFSMLNI